MLTSSVNRDRVHAQPSATRPDCETLDGIVRSSTVSTTAIDVRSWIKQQESQGKGKGSNPTESLIQQERSHSGKQQWLSKYETRTHNNRFE